MNRFKTGIYTLFVITNLNALSIDEAVSTALANSLELKKMQNNVELTKSDISEKRSANYGRLDALVSYNHYNLPRTLAPLTPASLGSSPQAIATTKDLFSAGVAYNIELFNGLEDKRNIEIASLQQEIARSSKMLSKEQLIYNVKTLYINILTLQAQEEAQKNYVDALKALHKDIEYKVELQSLARIDMLKSLADLERASASLREIQSNIEIMKFSLKSAMLVESIDALVPIEINVSEEMKNDDSFENKLEKTSRLKLAKLATEKNKKQEDKSLAVYYPKIGFNGYYGQNIGFNDESHVKPGEWNNAEIWQVGLDLKWNIFDFGKSAGVREKTQIHTLQSRLDETALQRDMSRALSEGLSKIEIARSNFKSASSELNLMRETEKIEEVRYQSGASDINDLLYTKARKQLAQSRYISAQYGYQNALIYVDYLLEQGSEK